jgi:hypothetical protein
MTLDYDDENQGGPFLDLFISTEETQVKYRRYMKNVHFGNLMKGSAITPSITKINFIRERIKCCNIDYVGKTEVNIRARINQHVYKAKKVDRSTKVTLYNHCWVYRELHEVLNLRKFLQIFEVKILKL